MQSLPASRVGLEVVASVPGLRWSLRARPTLWGLTAGSKRVVHEFRLGVGETFHDFPTDVDILWTNIVAKARLPMGRHAQAQPVTRRSRSPGAAAHPR